MPQPSPSARLSFWSPLTTTRFLAAVLAVGLCLYSARPVQAQRLLTAPTMQEYAKFGAAVVDVGDLDGDDVPELAVGAPREAVGETNEVGRVHVFSGSDSELLYSLAPTEPTTSESHFGKALTSLDDVGDGGAHGIVVGAPWEAVEGKGDEAGRVYVYSGTDTEPRFTLVSPQATEGGRFGRAVAAPGDLTGDGIGEIVIGAPGESNGDDDAGRVYVFDGADGSLVYAIDAQHSGSGEFGTAVAGVESVNDDGVPDFLVGAPEAPVEGESGAGRAYLFSGASGDPLYSFSYPNEDALRVRMITTMNFGAAVASGGDLTGDGVPDLLIGAPRGDEGGELFIYSGTDGKQISELEPEGSNAFFGAAVTVLGPEGEETPARVVVAAPYDGGPGVEGRVYIFQGERDIRDPHDAEPRRLAFRGDRGSDPEFGRAIAPTGDLDGDGRSDLAVGMPDRDGTPEGDTTYDMAGGVRIYQSKTDTLRRPEVFTEPFQAPEAPEGFSTHVADWGEVRFGLVYPDGWEVVDLAKKGFFPILDLSRTEGTAKKRWAGGMSASSDDEPEPLRLFGAENASIFVMGKGLLGGDVQAAFEDDPAPRRLIDPSDAKARVREPAVIQPLRDTTIAGFDAAVFGVEGKSREGHEVRYEITVLDTPGKMLGVKVLRPQSGKSLSDEALRTMFDHFRVGPPSRFE